LVFIYLLFKSALSYNSNDAAIKSKSYFWHNAKSDTKPDTNEVCLIEHPPFGEWLRKKRRDLDLSRQQLADQADCAEITLRRIEGGTLKPSKELAAILLEKVGILKSELDTWIQFARGLSGFPLRETTTPEKRKNTNLPAQLTSFIGREKELADVTNLVAKYRLVTLIGTGGVGKTRLSIKVGEGQITNFSDGVWLVELAPLDNPQLIPQTVTSTLGVPISAAQPIAENIFNFLLAKTALLIFDNCEHLLDAVAGLIDDLLKQCPHLKILATSREGMGIMGEATYIVPAMTLPDANQILDTIRDLGSVRLFVERARLVDFDFSLTMDNASFIGQICHRLDGIPLALELAAVQVSQFSLVEIAKQLEDSFHILTGGNRTALPRQQTIRASIDWSWNLLTDDERALLRCLSVFVGGWTLEAAQAVCGGNLLTLVNSLVKKSLVVQNQAKGGEKRYHFHELIRQYTREKLVEAVDEVDNLRAALNCALRMDNIEAGLSISSNLGRRFLESFDAREGLEWLTKFLQNPGAEAYPIARAKALSVQSGLYFSLQKFDDARQSGETALGLFRAHGDVRGEIDVLIKLGGVMQYLEGWDRKVEIQEQALGLAQSINDVWREAKAYGALGWDHRNVEKAYGYWQKAVQLFRQLGDWGNLTFYLGVFGEWLVSTGKLQQAEQFLREADELNRQMGNRREMEFVLTAHGYLALAARDYDRAIDHFSENARLLNEVGNRMGYLWAQARLGYAVALKGDTSAAQTILFETLSSFHTDGNKDGVVFTTSKVASLYAAINQYEVAAQLIGWSDSNVESARPAIDQAGVDRDIQLIQERIGVAEYTDAYKKGRALGMNEVVGLALRNYGYL